MGRVLTLVIAPDTEDVLEDSVEAANFASREHPCRVIAVLPGDRKAAEPRLDAEIRVGADAGAGEVVVLRLSGELADHASSVVLPFLLAGHAGGGLVARGRSGGARTGSPWASWRFAASPMQPTAATRWRRSRADCKGYTAGDTDLAWSRITYWRALLATALDQAPFEPINSALVSGLKTEPALDILAGWLASRIDAPVQRAVGDLKVELERSSETVTLSRPQTGVTATLTRTGRPEALIPLARRDAKECLAEDLRRLDADEIYFEALEGIEKVQYV